MRQVRFFGTQVQNALQGRTTLVRFIRIIGLRVRSLRILLEARARLAHEGFQTRLRQLELRSFFLLLLLDLGRRRRRRVRGPVDRPNLFIWRRRAVVRCNSQCFGLALPKFVVVNNTVVM